jgi:hypothetical protein
MKITFDIARQQIGIEGDGPELLEILTLAREIAPKLPEINIVTSGVRQDLGKGQNGTTTPAPTTITTTSTTAAPGPVSQTLRTFVKSLKLSSLAERITAIAYYQKHVLGRDFFAPKDMADWFIQCGLQKPSQMPVAVFDAKKKQGLVENAGHGAWKISTQGENLIICKIEESLEPQE